MKYQAVFIDRDGTMGDNPEIKHPQEFVPFIFLPEAINLLKSQSEYVFALTNQSCIARGDDNNYDFKAEFTALGLNDFFICPHNDPDNCNCRKPKPGLFYKARDKYNLDLSKCVMIGDRWSDMKAAEAAEVHTILVLSGRGKSALSSDRGKWNPDAADYIAKDILDAALWIKNAK